MPDGANKRGYTIKGIGLQTAAALGAKIISIDRFQSDSAAIGYFGIFPEEKDTSGTQRDGSPKPGSALRMCATGNDLVRRLLYTAAQSAVMHNPLEIHRYVSHLPRATLVDYIDGTRGSK